MNEATLESNLNATLDRVFRGPLRPKIEHQRVLTLRFGHHAAMVDGVVRSEARGRLDVLLRAEERPLAVLELKRKGLALTVDDETQAWSYARLLDPMPPFYIVTNGDETRLFRTYDRQRIESQSIDEQILADQIAAAAGAAATDAMTAIRFLLGRSPEVFRQLFGRVTQAELGLATGPVGDLMRPLTAEFRLPRLATGAVLARIIEKRPVIVLVGPPLSGKTNVVAELCDACEHGQSPAQRVVPLYVNCSQRPQGIFQTLATGLMNQTGVPATADDVRHWLTAGGITTDEDRPVIILDAWPTRSSERWEGQLGELLELAGDQTFTLLVVLDEVQAEAMLVEPHRGQPSRLGSLSMKIRLRSLLSHQELAVAAYHLTQHNGLLLEQGCEHNIFYRYPYTWRLLACEPRTNGVVPSVLGAEYVHAARRILNPSAGHVQLLRRFAEGVADENANGPVREVLLGSPGWSTWETAERVVGERGLEQLQEAGFIRARKGPRDCTLASVQIPPLLASIAANLLSERLAATMGTSSPPEAVSELLQQCQRFPYGALVGSKAILSLDTQSLTASVIEDLLTREPGISRMPSDARVGLLFEGLGMMEVPPDIIRQSAEEGADHVFGDPLPYLILSYMASWIDVTSAGGQAIFARILDRVGSVGMPIFPVDFGFGEKWRVALPVASHNLPGGRTLLNCSNGILEPITDAVRRAALESPEMVGGYVASLLAREAPSIPLLYRVWMAVASVSSMTTPVATLADQWANRLNTRVQERLHAEIGNGAKQSQSTRRENSRDERMEKKRKRREKRKQKRRNR